MLDAKDSEISGIGVALLGFFIRFIFKCRSNQKKKRKTEIIDRLEELEDKWFKWFKRKEKAALIKELRELLD